MTPEELANLKSMGFVVTTNEDPDFFDSMVSKFISANPHLTKAANKKLRDILEQFVVFTKDTLAANPPSAITYLDRGLALQFADYTRSILLDNRPKTQSSGKAVVITDSDRSSGGPITFKQVDTSIQITR